MNIVVLAGGLSPERDVSLSSGSLIANALIENGHNVMLLDLFFGTDNNEIKAGYVNKSDNYIFNYVISEDEPDLKKLKSSSSNGKNQIGKNVIEICKSTDVVFLALHGAAGENGQLQALFDLYGISYTGSGYDGCLIAMDKDLSKRIMRDNGILTAPWHTVNPDDNADISSIKFPCVVKPCGCGSSVGVSITENKNDFDKAVKRAAEYEKNILIEEKISGREFSVGILNGRALAPIEIIPLNGFYDYKNKYQQGNTNEICPADITPEEDRLLRDSALKVHKALRLGFYSRVDFILDKNGYAYCLEANTLPGMTPTSLLPQEASAEGISYNELCDMIAENPFAL